MRPRLRARLGYWLARRLFHWPWLLRQPRAWTWMQGQYARMAALGNVSAQSFYGHILLFRGQGFGAREEGLRLLRLAAQGGMARRPISWAYRVWPATAGRRRTPAKPPTGGSVRRMLATRLPRSA